MKKFILFFFAMVMFAANAMAREVVFDISQLKGNSYVGDDGSPIAGPQDVTLDGVTITTDIDAIWNSQYRFYKNSNTTFSTRKGTIVSIEFTCTASGTANYGPGNFTTEIGQYTYDGKVGTWTGDASEVVLKAATNQVRATQIVVTLAEKEGEVDFEKSNIAAINQADFVEAGQWYLLKQKRGGVSPVYDAGVGETMKRAANDKAVVAGMDAADAVNYLLRFIPASEGAYNIQFANGHYWASTMTTTEEEPGEYNVYNINGEATHIGINLFDMANIVDNNGAGNTLAFWASGEVKELNGNNDWTVWEVEFAEKSEAAAELKALVDEYEAAYTANNVVVEVGEGIITSTDQFSSEYTDEEEGSLANLLDGDGSTFWHSTWHHGNDTPMHVHYLQVEFAEPISGAFELNMNRRVNNGGMCQNDNPVKMSVEISLDGEEFVLADEFDTPFTQSGAAPLVQATVNIPTPAKYLRFFADECNGGNNRGYWHCGDFQLKPIVTPAPNAAYPEAAAAFAEALAAAKEAGANATGADVVALKAAYEAYLKGLQPAPAAPEYLTAAQVREKAATGRFALLGITSTGDHYINGEAGTGHVSADGTLAGVRDPEANEIVYLVQNGEQYNIQRECDGKFFQVNAGGNINLVDDATSATPFFVYGKDDAAYGPVSGYADLFSDIEATTNDLMVRFVANNQWLNGQGCDAIGGLRGGTGAWSFQYVRYMGEKEVVTPEPTTVDVVYTVKFNGEVVKTATVAETIGAAPSFDVAAPAYVVVEGMPETIAADTKAVELTTTLDETVPFEVGKNYVVFFRNGACRYYWNDSNEGVGNEVRWNGNPSDINSREELESYTETAKWTMGGNWVTGFTFTNAVTGKTLTAPAAISGGTACNLDEEPATGFDIVQQTNGHFRFYPHGDAVNFLAHTSHGSHRVTFWNKADYGVTSAEEGGASCVQFEEIKEAAPTAVTFEFTDNEDGTITITPSDLKALYFFNIYSDRINTEYQQGTDAEAIAGDVAQNLTAPEYEVHTGVSVVNPAEWLEYWFGGYVQYTEGDYRLGVVELAYNGTYSMGGEPVFHAFTKAAEVEPVDPDAFPAEGVAYKFKNVDSQLYVKVIDDAEQCVTLGQTPDEMFFTAVEGGWTISTSKGYQLGSTAKGWNIGNTATPIVWTIEEVEGGYAFKNEKGYLGYDTAAAGQKAFRDKNYSTHHGIFNIWKYDEEEIIVEPEKTLEETWENIHNLLTEAEAIKELNEVTVTYDSDGYFEDFTSPIVGKVGYKKHDDVWAVCDGADYVNSFVSYFETAAEADAYLADFGGLAALEEIIQNVIDDYNAAEVVLPTPGKTYVIRNYPYTYSDEYSYAYYYNGSKLALAESANATTAEYMWTVSEPVKYSYFDADLNVIEETRYQFVNAADNTKFMSWRGNGTDNYAGVTTNAADANSKWYLTGKKVDGSAAHAYGTLALRTNADGNQYRTAVVDMRKSTDHLAKSNGDHFDATYSSWFIFEEVEVPVTEWDGNEPVVEVKDDTTVKVTFNDAHSVEASNLGVLAAIYDEQGDVYGIVFNDLFGETVEFGSDCATLHFKKISEINAELAASVKSISNKVLSAVDGVDVKGKVVICGKSFKIDGEALYTKVIVKDFDFNAGDITTGIDAIATDANVKVFDLQGRRVAVPAKGIFVREGRKVVR